jgi:serine protease AprX
MSACALCGLPSTAADLAESRWASRDVEERLAADHPGWRREDGACPACVQETLLQTLLERGEAAYHESIQRAWPLDAQAAFGALPTPLRLHADARFAGRGVTVALVDAGFHPHRDLVTPTNRIRAWVDASRPRIRVKRFTRTCRPEWPGWDAGEARQWHGLMTSAAAAGNGRSSHGLYRGLAPEADLVLVQVQDERGRITNDGIARALGWLHRHGPRLGVRVVSLSLGGDAVEPLAGNPVDRAVTALIDQGVTVLAAAGNDGVRRLVPPATAPEAITVGGLDDRNTLDERERALWHGNYGHGSNGAGKPDLVAPSLFVVAPLLPATDVATEAASLFARRAAGEREVDARIGELKLVTPHYQHVEGTSFAAPLVAGLVACMLEANPELGPRRIRELLLRSSQAIPGAPPERQGAGAIDAGRAVTLALVDRHAREEDLSRTPVIDDASVRFLLHEHAAREVHVVGSWDEWSEPGLPAREVEPGLWEASRPHAGSHSYKFLLDRRTWLTDPGNPARAHDGYGGWNSLITAG